MSNYNNLFAGIAAAQPINSFSQRLAPGKHRLVMKKFAAKESKKDHGTILEADFLDTASGETRGWAWFVGSKGWAGAYEQARAKDFLTEVGKCVADDSPVDQIGAALASDAQQGRGLTLDVEITAQMNADNTPKRNKKGQPLLDATWKYVEQTLEDIKAARAELDAMDAAAPTTQPAASTSGPAFGAKGPAGIPPASPPKTGLGIAGRLGGPK